MHVAHWECCSPQLLVYLAANPNGFLGHRASCLCSPAVRYTGERVTKTPVSAPQAMSGPLDLKSGKAATVSFGRPSLFPIIRNMIAEHSSDERIALIASGKPSAHAIPGKSHHAAKTMSG